MKRKILALTVVACMLLCTCLFGCNKADETTVTEAPTTTQVVIVEKTPTEHFAAMFDALLAKEADNALMDTLNDGYRATISLGNIEPLLALSGVDTSTMPPISDIALDMYAGADGKYGAEVLSLMIGDKLCDVSLFADLEKMVISSAQLTDVYGMTYDELYDLAGVETEVNFEDLLKYDQQYFENIGKKYIDLFEKLVTENAVITKVEEENAVTLTLEFDANAIATVIDSIVKTFATDEDLIAFWSEAYGYDVTEDLASVASYTDTLAEDLAADNSAIKATVNVDKDTYFAKDAQIVLTATDISPITIDIDNSNGCKVTASCEDEVMVLDINDKGISFVMTAAEEELFNLSAVAENGKFTASFVESGESIFSFEGAYEVTDTTFTFVCERLTYADVAIELSEYDIAFNVDLAATAPAMPEPTVSIITLDEEAFKNIALQFIVNSGIIDYIQ